jgi:hypothetical protein
MEPLSIFAAIKSIIDPLIKPAFDLVDELHVSEEERLNAKAKLENAFSGQMFAIVNAIVGMVKSQATAISAEATGGWLQRSWRPIIMLMFGWMIFWNYWFAPVFGLTRTPMPMDLMGVIKIGLGGYVIGRSGEKMIPKIIELIKQGKGTV